MRIQMKKGLSLILAGSLLAAVAGCATGGYYYSSSEGTSEVTRQFEQAKELYNQKLYDSAQERFQEILSDSPESPLAEVAMYYLAGCHQQKQELEQARSLYQALIDKYRYGFWVDASRNELQELKPTAKN